MPSSPSFTLGMEEEYLLVDRETRDVVSDPPESILKQCQRLTENHFVEPELLRSQIEVNTKVCQTAAEAGAELARLRRLVVEIADQHGMAPIAASTHPFGHWRDQHHTEKARYKMLSRSMQSLAQRMLICGMHVHVGIDEDELRIDLLNQFTHFLPLLLALSTSSPFWEGEVTGLKSYRLTVFDNFPRTGLPERYTSYSEYEHQVETLKQAGIIEDATVFWWDLRVSARYPTLEMRITDTCTDLADAVALAALTQSILRYLYRLRCRHMAWRVYPRFLVDQNRWRAMRYGLDEGQIDFATARIVPVKEMVKEVVEMVREDAEALDCVKQLDHVYTILERGTSAHRQLACFDSAQTQGKSRDESLREVVDLLIAETAKGMNNGQAGEDDGV